MSIIRTFVPVTEEQAKTFKKDSSGLEDFLFSQAAFENPRRLDMDKAWDGVHYLLINGSDSF